MTGICEGLSAGTTDITFEGLDCDGGQTTAPEDSYYAHNPFGLIVYAEEIFLGPPDTIGNNITISRTKWTMQYYY